MKKIIFKKPQKKFQNCSVLIPTDKYSERLVIKLKMIDPIVQFLVEIWTIWKNMTNVLQVLWWSPTTYGSIGPLFNSYLRTMVSRKLDLATLTTAHLLYLLNHWTQHIPFHPAAGDADSSSFQHNGKRGVKYLFAKFTAPRCSLPSHLLSLQCLYSPHLTSISPRRADWQNSPGVWAKSERWKKSWTTTQSISRFRELFCKSEVFSLFYVIIPRSC